MTHSTDADRKDEKPIWKMGLVEMFRKRPFASVAYAVVVWLLWHFVVWPTVDAGLDKIDPPDSQSQITLVIRA